MQAHKQATADMVGETARRHSAAAAGDQARLLVSLQASPLCAPTPVRTRPAPCCLSAAGRMPASSFLQLTMEDLRFIFPKPGMVPV